MEYISGNIHEKLQVERIYKILTEWNIVTCKRRYNDVDMMDDNEFDILPVEVGDFIVTRLFKPNGMDSIPYHYIDRVIKNGVVSDVKLESLMSREFVDQNQKNQVLFEEASIKDIRDIKINQIIK